MRKIDLNELYGGWWCFFDECDGGRSDDLEIKTLREHLEEWIQQTDYLCIQENKQRIQDILDGRITETEDGMISLVYNNDFQNDVDDDPLYWYYDEVVLNPLVSIKKKIADEAREQGIRPPQTWYREEVDRIAYKATHPADSSDDCLPF